MYKVKKRLFLKTLLGLTVLLFVLYQADKNSRMDDNLIGENLYFLLKDGVVRSEMMRGYGGLSLEVHQTIFHKFFIYLAYPFVALTGWSLFSLHAFVLLCFAGLLWALWRGFGFLVPSYFPEDRLLYFCVFLINYNTLYFSGTFRPEVLLTLLGFLQFVVLKKYLAKPSAGLLLVAALLGGSGLATHPHGAIFLVAGTLLLAFQKRLKALPVYMIAAGLSFAAIYFADILLHDTLAVFLYQAAHDPLIAAQQKEWYSPLLALADEHVRLFFNEREIVTSLLLLASGAFAFKEIKQQNKPLLLYFFCSFLALGLISYSNSPQYLLLYSPYVMALIIFGFRSAKESANKLKKYSWFFLLTAYFAVHLAFAFFHSWQNIRDLDKPGPAARNKAIAAWIPQPHATLSVLACDDFLFDEIKHFRRIQSITQYSFFREAQHLPPLELSGLLDSAGHSGVDYVILTPVYVERFGATDSLLLLYATRETVPYLYHHSAECTIFRLR